MTCLEWLEGWVHSGILSHLCYGLVDSILSLLSLIECICVCVGAYVHINAGACRGDRRVSGPLEPEVQVAINCHSGLLEAEEQYLVLNTEPPF